MRKTWDERRITLNLTVVATPSATLEQQLHELLRHVSQRSGLQTLVWQRPDGFNVQAEVEVVREVAIVRRNPSVAQVSVEFVVPGVFLERYQVTESTTVSSSPAQIVLGNRGVAEITDVVIDLDGPLSDVIIQPVGGTWWIRYAGSIAVGETVQIDCGAFTATLLPSNTNVLDNVNTSGQPVWFVIPPNPEPPSQNTYDITATTTGGTVRVTYNELY